MYKHIFIFLIILFLTACAGGQLRQISPEVRQTKKVNFFAQGHTEVAFKLVGTLNKNGLEGVLIAKKIGEDDFDVTVLTSGAYRVLQATVTPSGVAYRYLFKEADTSLVRAKINQFLNLLLSDVGVYQRERTSKETRTITYKNQDASVRLMYKLQDIYPFAAKTITLLNSADLTYKDYAPIDNNGTAIVPHEMKYKDGKIEVFLTLIGLK